MTNPARLLAKLTGTFHNISYYAPEMKAFAELGLPEYWRAYMAYRSAPMGIVAPSVVESTFYNFAPVRVAEAIPSAWQATTAADVMALRDECIAAALDRSLGGIESAPLDDAAAVLLDAINSVEAGARPLFAAHRELAVPASPLMRLWFACTLWREHRGDGHNVALAAAEIDGIECHVLLAARGVGDQATIGKIRGWRPVEWQGALDRLVNRGLLTPAGDFTDDGRAVRSAIEMHTDRLAAAPRNLLEPSAEHRVVEVLEPLVATLVSSGAVAGQWPPRTMPGT